MVRFALVTVSVEGVVPPSSSAATLVPDVRDTEYADAVVSLPMQTTSLDVGTTPVDQFEAVPHAVPVPPVPPVHESVHAASACAAVLSTRSAAPKEVKAVSTKAALAAARPNPDPTRERHMRIPFRRCYPGWLVPPLCDTPNATRRPLPDDQET
jgi:hypothetical protein